MLLQCASFLVNSTYAILSFMAALAIVVSPAVASKTALTERLLSRWRRGHDISWRIPRRRRGAPRTAGCLCCAEHRFSPASKDRPGLLRARARSRSTCCLSALRSKELGFLRSWEHEHRVVGRNPPQTYSFRFGVSGFSAEGFGFPRLRAQLSQPHKPHKP